MAKSNFEPACCTDRNCYINLRQLWELSETEVNMNFCWKAQRAEENYIARLFGSECRKYGSL